MIKDDFTLVTLIERDRRRRQRYIRCPLGLPNPDFKLPAGLKCTVRFNK